MSIQGGIDVHTISNQFDGHPGVFQERNHWAWLASMDRAHRVEQVRPHRRPRRDRRLRLLVGRLGVADRGHRTRIDDSADRRERSGALGRQGHHANRPITYGQNAVELGRVRVAHQGRLVGAAPLGRQPGTFQMNPRDHAGPNLVGQFRDLPYQLGRPGGDQ